MLGYGPVIIVPSVVISRGGRVFLMTVMILCFTPAAVDSAEGVPCRTGVGEEGYPVYRSEAV